jgi:exonuclease III
MLASNNRVGKQVQGKRGNKQLALTLASDYRPSMKTGNDKPYLCFLNTLDTLLNQLPAKLEIIMGAGINSNIGTLDDLHSTKFCSALGPHSLPKCNKKGKNFFNIYIAHHLHIMNTFFKTRSNNPGHSTWTSNRPTSSGTAGSHMLDVIVCSAPLHKRIHNCCTIQDEKDSDHRAVRMDLNLTSIKYKEKTSMNYGDIDWRKIREEDEQQKLYNKYLLKLTSRDMSNNNFC